MQKKDTIAFVMSASGNAIPNIREYAKANDKNYRILLIADKKRPLNDVAQECDEYISVDFSSPEKISEALLPYQDRLIAITCLGDANMARFAKIIPNVPYLRTPTSESLAWATDKYAMRKRFNAYDSSITPKFSIIKENTKAERTRIIEKVGFPMIVKPTNLAGSLFVQICYHEDELQKALGVGFRKIQKAYENDGRLETPKILAEQFIEGDMYSVDSYVDSRGNIYHCPLVRVKTGRDIGHKDFYGYLQVTPTILKKETIERAQEITEHAIHALGLRSTSAHTELIKVDSDWKVVEVGARIGGARDVLYDLSCDIKHTTNDILIRIPRKPVIPKKCKGYAAYMKWFAPKEGIITEMKGIKKIEQLESFYRLNINKKIGDKSVFASHGGRSVFNLFLYNSERSKLLADIRRVEQMVEVKVKNGRGKTAAKPKVTTKNVAKKTAKTKK